MIKCLSDIYTSRYINNILLKDSIKVYHFVDNKLKLRNKFKFGTQTEYQQMDEEVHLLLVMNAMLVPASDNHIQNAVSLISASHVVRGKLAARGTGLPCYI